MNLLLRHSLYLYLMELSFNMTPLIIATDVFNLRHHFCKSVIALELASWGICNSKQSIGSRMSTPDCCKASLKT